MRIPLFCLLTCLFVASTVRADDLTDSDDKAAPAKNFDDFQEANETTCVGAPDARQTAANEYDLNGFHYVVNGGHATVTRSKPRTHPDIRLGVLNAIKDNIPETQANLADFIAKFKTADVDAIIVDGDTAYDEDEIQAILGQVGKLGVPVYAVAGNAETKSGFNRALKSAWDDAHNILNADLIRVYDGDGFHFVSLPGYYDRRFASSVAPCIYSTDDVHALAGILANAAPPTIVVTHGPPKQNGAKGIDYTPQAGNVGDPALADVLAKAKIAFGVFGHIIEAGGRATDATGKHEIKPGVLSETLYLNPGPVNSAPWKMNAGYDSYGMAAILTLENGKAKYEVFKAPQRMGK